MSWKLVAGRLADRSDVHSQLMLWDIQTGTLLASQQAHFGKVSAISVSDDGQSIMTGGVDTTVQVWRLTAPSD